jgi:hypothetical protein
LSRALAAFEHSDAAVFLRGMKHIQLEPVYGGVSDSAGTLRATCALALVQCRSLPEADLLRHLVELFADKDKSVRVEVAHAVENVNSLAAALVLRVRAILGNDEPEVLGACYSGILQIEGTPAIPWVGKYVADADEAAGEAALALAGTHKLEAFNILREQLEAASDRWFRSVLLSAIALTRQEVAVEFLFEQVKKESLLAEAAIEALLRAGLAEESISQLEKAVAGSPRLQRVFRANRSSDSLRS